VAIVNIGMNWRMQRAGIRPETAGAQLARQIGTQPESEHDPHLPVELVLAELDLHMVMQTSTVAQRWKLRPRNEAPGEGAMRDLITRRYHYGEDDVAHRDLLACLGEDATLLPILGQSPGA
jgi:hypothetical protein